MFYIAKGYRPLSSTENVWLKRLVHHECSQVVFVNKQQFISEINMVSKTMECHVILTLVEATTIITTFDLWMSWTSFATFVFVVNYINKNWQPCHIIMGFFEVHETMGGYNGYAIIKSLLAWYELFDKIMTYVKDEGANLSTITMALMNIISCVPFMLLQTYATISYGHAMSKCCQYATNDFKMCNGMREVSIKAT